MPLRSGGGGEEGESEGESGLHVAVVTLVLCYPGVDLMPSQRFPTLGSPIHFI